uniref:Exocyst complex component 3 like 1 n=1 Tax=Apteryx owenii TaxID=8824 RepID=A0A8B9QF11_APTOW
MGMSAEDEHTVNPKDEEWPEAEKAEKLARGAALKWASGVFYRPEKLEALGQYRSRETQRNSSIQSRLKSTVQSYLEGVSAGLEQLRSAAEEVQNVCQDLGAARWALLDSADHFQVLQQMRALMAEHVQLASVVKVLPQLFSGKVLAQSMGILAGRHLGVLQRNSGLHAGLVAKLEQVVQASSSWVWKVSGWRCHCLPRTCPSTVFAEPQVSDLSPWNLRANPGPQPQCQSPSSPVLNPVISPPSPTVHEVFSHTLQLLHEQHLLEAHAELMMLEHLRDDILFQLHLRGLSSAQATVLSYFSGLQELNESLAKQLWGIVGRSLQLVQEDPVLFVSAVRIVEREEKIDDALLLDATFLPPGRPKGWRQKFYHILQETITGSHFHTACMDTTGPGLSRHLAALQRDVVAELHVVKDLMVQCVPAHYNILSICTAMYHQALTSHLQDILQEDLDKQALFLLLEWVLHVYHSPEMMSHPGLLPEVDVSALGPLISPDLVDQTERKYVVKVKMLNENIRVASLITGSLQQKVYSMAMEELEAFLGRLREALVQCGKEHQKDRTIPKYYVPYLLAVLNNNLALSSSVPSLHPDTAHSEVPVSLRAALDRMQRKACQLLLEELLLDLQPLCMQLPSRKWLSGSQLVSSMCEVIDKYAKDFSRVRKPIFMLLLMESERLVTSQYLRALMQKKMVCKSEEERSQLCDRLLQDATQLRELFYGLGLDRNQQSLEAVFALRELICLKDPALLSLEVLGFITKYPDVSDEHVSTLLDLRGDVSKEVRHMVLEMMAQHPQALPESYQPIFSMILVPAPELPLCLRKGKCA